MVSGTWSRPVPVALALADCPDEDWASTVAEAGPKVEGEKLSVKVHWLSGPRAAPEQASSVTPKAGEPVTWTVIVPALASPPLVSVICRGTDWPTSTTPKLAGDGASDSEAAPPAK